jgi:hypothetical protein
LFVCETDNHGLSVPLSGTGGKGFFGNAMAASGRGSGGLPRLAGRLSSRARSKSPILGRIADKSRDG